MSNLAKALKYQQKYPEALAELKAVCEIKEKNLGRKNKTTLVSMDNLGALLHEMGQFEEALLYRQVALQGFKEMYGIGHNSTRICAKGVVAALESIGDRADEIRKLQE